MSQEEWHRYYGLTDNLIFNLFHEKSAVIFNRTFIYQGKKLKRIFQRRIISTTRLIVSMRIIIGTTRRAIKSFIK